MKHIKHIVGTLLMAVFIITTAAAAVPLDVEQQNIDDVLYIVKAFSLAPGESAETLAEPDFEDGSYSYTLHTVTSEEQTTEERKTVSESVSVESDSGVLSEVLKLFAPTVVYDKDGFAGTLTLDATTIVTEVSEYRATLRTVSDTREFTGMTYADPSALPQSIVKDGVTLPLTDISWTVIGTDLVGDSLIPTEYKATATYSKTVSGSVPSKYISTANYSGEVTCRTVDSVLYTLTYIGTPIPVFEPEPEPAPEPKSFPMWLIYTVLGVVLAGGIAAAVYIIISRRNAYRYYGGGV